jgi:hypothetical protein
MEELHVFAHPRNCCTKHPKVPTERASFVPAEPGIKTLAAKTNIPEQNAGPSCGPPTVAGQSCRGQCKWQSTNRSQTTTSNDHPPDDVSLPRTNNQSTHPVPETKHVFRCNSKSLDVLFVCRQCDKVLGDMMSLSEKIVSRSSKRVSPTSLACSRNHFFFFFLFVMVSCVVNVLDATMNTVVSGFTARSVSAKCVPSMLETK